MKSLQLTDRIQKIVRYYTEGRLTNKKERKAEMDIWIIDLEKKTSSWNKTDWKKLNQWSTEKQKLSR